MSASRADEAMVLVKDAPEVVPPPSFLDGVTFVEATLTNHSAE